MRYMKSAVEKAIGYCVGMNRVWQQGDAISPRRSSSLPAKTRSDAGLSSSLFEPRSIYDLDTGRDSADLVVCCEVLEHLEHPDAGLLALQRVVGRHLIVSVPKEPLWCALNLARGNYIGHWGNTPGHIQHWSKGGFIRLVSKYFDVIEVKRPLPWTMLLCKPRG